MSSPINGGNGNTFMGTILPHTSQGFQMHHDSGGWPGNAVVAAQALDPLSKLTVSDLGASLGGNGVYNWPFTITNEGSFPVSFLIQVSFV